MDATREAATVEKIAAEILHFHDLIVDRIKESLEAAYRAGYSAAKA